MELFDDFDLEAKGYLRADQLQQAYYEVFDQTSKVEANNLNFNF